MSPPSIAGADTPALEGDYKARSATRPLLSARATTVFRAITIAGLFAAGLYAGVTVPLRSIVTSYGKISPAREWVLKKGTDGQLIASTVRL